jgi:hypothetical protein
LDDQASSQKASESPDQDFSSSSSADITTDKAGLKRKLDTQTQQEKRYDYALQVSLMEMLTSGYFAGMPAHFAYWRSYDIVYHILKQCYDLQNEA